jgi:putative SOS response-associated peptidase YedK
MCGRYTNTRGPEEIEQRFGLRVPGDVGTRRYNVAPTEEVLAIVERHGEREMREMRWGLIPQWRADRAKSAYKMINVRVEGAASNSTYSRLLARPERRALQIADGWYEWLKPEKPREPRQPFHFRVDGGELFAFAALWTPTKVSDEEWLSTIALLTCDASANPVARAVHDRMPVVLADRDAQEAWIDPSVGVHEALSLCGPLTAERTTAHPANPAVNSVEAPEGPELLLAPNGATALP